MFFLAFRKQYGRITKFWKCDQFRCTEGKEAFGIENNVDIGAHACEYSEGEKRGTHNVFRLPAEPNAATFKRRYPAVRIFHHRSLRFVQ